MSSEAVGMLSFTTFDIYKEIFCYDVILLIVILYFSTILDFIYNYIKQNYGYHHSEWVKLRLPLINP